MKQYYCLQCCIEPYQVCVDVVCLIFTYMLQDPDVEFWKSRDLTFLNDPEKWRSENPRTLEACCTRAKTRERSLAYLSTLEDVCVVRALAVGIHATSEGHKKAGLLEKIPLSTYLSVGMVAKLTMNLSPEHMHL